MVAWTYFNGWRKKYWLTRTLIILLLFLPILYEKFRGHPIVCDLVKYACEAIISNNVPQCEYTLCKYYKIVEIKRLQTSIIVYADKNQNGVLDADEIALLKSKGCNTDEIQKSVLNADMDKLADDAGRLGLLPPAYSTTQIRKNAFNAAHSETEFAFKPLTDEIFDLIERMNWFYPRLTEKQINDLKICYTEKELRESPVVPNYCSWATWRMGLRFFLYGFTEPFGPLIATMLWFSISIMLGLFSAITFKSYRKLMSALASLIFLFFILYLGDNLIVKLSMGSLFMQYNLLFGLLIFSIVAGLIGFNISRYVKDKIKWRILTAMIIGFLIIPWSFNLDFQLSFGWGIGCLVSPVTGKLISGVNACNTFSQNSIMFAESLILVSLVFLLKYYQNEISDFICKFKRRKK